MAQPYHYFNSVLFFLILFLTPFHTILPHGTVTFPPSRVWVCFNELTTGVSNETTSPACTAAVIGWGTQAFYDWSEVARMDANDMHRDIIMDGNLASAGRPDKFGGIDQVRDDWIATDVTPGPFTLTWTLSAPHQTLYYEVYITKADWTPDQPLTWDNIELLTRTGPRPASATDEIDLVLPQRTGKHVLYSIWQRSLTPEAFYSTSDIDFGAPSEPVAPVAIFSSDNGECGGPEVTFNAEDSYDANGDELTYTWDFGDGNTAEGAIVTHTYADGIDSADVILTVSDGDFSSGATETINDLVEDLNCNETPPNECAFDTPRESAMPTMYYRSYNKQQGGSITVIGENGPDLTHIRKLDLAYSNGGINTFLINEWTPDQGFGGTGAFYYLEPEHTFGQVNPEITLSGTGIDNFDGSYYVNAIDNEEFGPNFADFVMVSKTGGFTIYFTYSSEAPDCDGEIPVEDPLEGGTITGGPFEFTLGDGIADYAFGVTLSGEEGDSSQWVISDEAGLILGLPAAPEDFNFDVTDGRTFIHHLSYNGSIQNLAVGNNVMALTGDYDFSNSIDVSELNDTPIDYENVVYDETVDGDLSTNNEAPTIIQLALGDNRVISSQSGTVDQANFFSFEVPEGYELSQLIVDSFEGSDDIGFIGLDAGNIITGQPANNAPSSLIGGLSYGTANIGTDILPEMGDISNPVAAFVSNFGFTPPLESGSYAVWLNQTGITSETVLNFVITATTTNTNTAPEANLNATPISGTTPLEVFFNASGSTDVNNDTLSYSIDYGDGSSGTGVTSTHVYNTVGEYTATITVNDGQGGTDTDSVTITVNDANPPIGNCDFDTPLTNALPSVSTWYGNVYVLGEGGPDMSNVTGFSVNWDLNNNGLYQFAFNMNVSPWYINFSNNSEQNFDQTYPGIFLTGTGIDGLDGYYYVTVHEGNFVMVSETFTIYFSGSTTAPDCEEVGTAAKSIKELSALSMYPNPAHNSVSLKNNVDLLGNEISISDLNGKELKSISITKSSNSTTIDISDMTPGLYIVRVKGDSGFSSLQKLIVK